MKQKFLAHIYSLQNAISSRVETIDGSGNFIEDEWERKEGGGGITRVLENGSVFEKAAVNTSVVHGILPKSMQSYLKVEESYFFACGLSLIFHPISPMIPTVHANWRYFELYNSKGEVVDQWFGGGQDLTPYYLIEDDAKHFHLTCKKVCDRHHPNFYSKFKKQCDDYFWNAHRGEARGVGGLFFDYCRASDGFSLEQWMAFVCELGNCFLESYLPIVKAQKNIKYTTAQRQWQEIRRGRYAEFNLIHDKGTLFGLKTNGRIESILVSMPPKVQWVYNNFPKKDSEEQKLIEVLKKPRDWIEAVKKI